MIKPYPERISNSLRRSCARAQIALTSPTSPGRTPMAWTTPTLVEICIGLEINGYLPAEF